MVNAGGNWSLGGLWGWPTLDDESESESITKADVEAVAGPLRAKIEELTGQIDTLNRERESLYTLDEVNDSISQITNQSDERINKLRAENQSLKSAAERYLESLNDIREALIGIPDKKSSQSFLLNDEKV